jgi:hypothetical protein
MHIYLPQSTCVEVEFKLISTPIDSNICELMWMRVHPNKAMIYLFMWVLANKYYVFT